MAPRKTKTSTSVKTTTKKNPWRSSHVPLPSWIMFWALILCTMALIVVNFSQAFAPAPVDAIDDTTAAQFAAIRASLEQQVANLQAQVSSSTTPSAPACEAVQNPGPADSHILYVDPKTHVSMSLPYSTSWGNGCAPFKVSDSAIAFGPLWSQASFGTGMDSSISISAATTSLSLERANAGEFASNFKQSTVNGISVLSYDVRGPAPVSHMWIGIGRTYVYRIVSVTGWLTDAEAVKIIQSLKVVK